VDGCDAIVGKGNAMSISGEVIEKFFGGTKRPFWVDIPGFVPQGLNEMIKAPGIGGFSGQDEFLFFEGTFEGFQESSTKDAAQRFIVEEEGLASGDPAGLVEGEGTLGEEAVEVEMVIQLLIPGMEDEGEARGTMEVCVREFHEDFGDGFEQEVQ
jgi:hypothetical protein